MKINPKDMKVQVNTNMRGGIGDVTLVHLQSGDQLAPHCRLHAQITVPAGNSIGYHVHEGETEVFHFISGKGHVDDDHEIVDIQSGDVVVTGPGHGHAVIADKGEDLVFDAVITLEK